MAGTPTTIPVVHASHVVVDTIDGYVFERGADGVLFTAQAARDFADHRNAERKPGHQTYRVFALVPDECTRMHRAAGCGNIHATDGQNRVYCGGRVLS